VLGAGDPVPRLSTGLGHKPRPPPPPDPPILNNTKHQTREKKRAAGLGPMPIAGVFFYSDYRPRCLLKRPVLHDETFLPATEIVKIRWGERRGAKGLGFAGGLRIGDFRPRTRNEGAGLPNPGPSGPGKANFAQGRACGGRM